jgi:hypothetical protein
MPASGALHRVAFVRIDVSDDRIASTIRMTRIGELGTTLAVTSNRRSLLRVLVTANVVPSSPILVIQIVEAICSSETSVLTRAILRNIPEDGILHNHRRENLKSYILSSICEVGTLRHLLQQRSTLFTHSARLTYKYLEGHMLIGISEEVVLF